MEKKRKKTQNERRKKNVKGKKRFSVKRNGEKPKT